ncbi:STAS domain-containing protein [Photobacterium leiognathi]|uniref:Anti-sigma factor antagonist n=1 Tax=Photobacterium leiognathi subsp. mandapamensis TaxID=48408 RepID=A0A2T3KY72_PHOLD|nr:STAS domain-containing protein [Photobacterium leiognathi]MCG3883452.1 STAS domain-containing protein [Photobacterium leiognathi]PHZ59405.1 anti-sigma factor antagonist [Photobacterium leiognathi]PSV02832.1 anti-sigma factor antagonist [Photobacterium leiognathi subsp. mandapamensis]PSV12595.1 anti-sigma factor antagonist [Photobacterium leiognathi subsp. mandapamensis]PSW39870.1 anti-sigma factor antagonist [Photobacterium leiognathi subsp. mandapamensis]
MFASSNSVIALALHDEFDAQRAKELEKEFDILSQTERMELVIDMTKVQFIDSCGIGAIVFLYKRLKSRGRRLRLLNVNGQPRELMQMLRIDKVIPLITSAELT